MKQVIGYLVKDDRNQVIGATGDEQKAMNIAHNYKGIVYRIVTTIDPLEDPTTERTVVYDGTK